MRNRAITPVDTEQDLVLEPAAYWEHFLEAKLNKALLKKKRNLLSEDTTVVVSVTKHSERLLRGFDDTSVDWAVIQKQLLKWGELFRAGRKLKLNLSFNYVDASSATTLSRGPRNRASTTNQMLAERAAQQDAEESSGLPFLYKEVYSLFRCPGPPCDLAPYCWCDPDGKKRYKLNTHHLRSLVQHAEDGKELRTHADVPDYIRKQLYAEDQQRIKAHQRATSAPAANFPPINITNVLPGQPHQTHSLGSSPALAPVPDMSQAPMKITRFDIRGTRDEILEECCAWQKKQVGREDYKGDYQKAYDYLIGKGIDIEELHQDYNVAHDLETKVGIKRGIAQRVVGDVEYWAKKYKQDKTLDQAEEKGKFVGTLGELTSVPTCRDEFIV